MKVFRAALVIAPALGAAGFAQAQASVKPDGQLRAVLGLGASLSSGNSDASNLSLTGDAVRATDQDKTTLNVNAQYATSEGETTSEQARLGGRYDFNLSPAHFAFGGLDFEHNRFTNVKLRGQLSGGLGWHLVQSPGMSLDLFGGLSYTAEKYFDPMLIDDEVRDSYDYLGLMLGEESTHELTETTSAKQRLTVVPNLGNSGEFRVNWDAGLAVAMNKTMSLTVGFSYAYNSEPGGGRESTDTTLTAGISVKFE